MTRRFRYAQGSPNMANLLLIDDDPDLLPDQIAHVFPSPEHRVEVAPPVPKVFAAAVQPDVIVLDLRLPGQSGLDVLKQLRQIDAPIPVVLVTESPRSPFFDEEAEGSSGPAFACGWVSTCGPRGVPLPRHATTVPGEKTGCRRRLDEASHGGDNDRIPCDRPRSRSAACLTCCSSTLTRP